MAEVNKEIEEMLTALGDPTPKDANLNEEEELENQEEESSEEDEEEKARLEEEERLKNETEDERNAREEKEAKEAEEARLANENKEKDALAQLEKERKDRELAAEAAQRVEDEKRKKAEEAITLEEQDFVGDLDLDELTHDKSAFNKLLNAVYTKGVSDSKKIATESVLMTLPDIVKYNINLVTTLEKAKDAFYEKNKDLAPFKAVVAAVFEDVAAKNSDKKINEIMDLVAPEVRTRLRLKENALVEEKKEEKPRLHGVRRGIQRTDTREKPETKGLADEIAAMNKALGL